MKYAIVIPDGAADEPQESLGGRTPLQSARTPNLDRLAREGVVGTASNVPGRFLPGSDVATLSLLGYDPERYFTGRAPLEAAAMGVRLGPEDWAVRLNLMTIQEGRLADFTAGHITNPEAAELIATLRLANPDPARLEFVPGVSYRNLLVVRASADSPTPFGDDTRTVPPHDHPDAPADDHMPDGPGSKLLRDLMAWADPILTDHPINLDRIADGKRPANAAWLWGQGRALSLPSFAEVRGLRAAMVSAVDLVRGVAALAGWDRIDAPGATGYLDTDYGSKARVAIQALDDHDLVAVHIEAPDEASHEGRAEAKVEAIERIDAEIVGPLRSALEAQGPWRLLASPDHATLLRTKAHDRAPVPWVMAGTGLTASGLSYDETSARSAGCPALAEGYRLMERFLDG